MQSARNIGTQTHNPSALRYCLCRLAQWMVEKYMNQIICFSYLEITTQLSETVNVGGSV